MNNKKLTYSNLACTLLFALAAISCVDGVDTDPKNLLGRWQMVKVIHQGKTILKPDPYQWRYEVEMEFLKDGTIDGTTSADLFSGSYEIASEDSIKIDGRQFSKVGIPDWGEYFYKNFRLITTFSFRKKGLNLKANELHLNHKYGELIFDRVK